MIAALFLAVSIDRPVQVDSLHDPFDYAVGIAQIVTAIGVPLLLLQIRSATLNSRSERTRQLIDRYLGKEFASQSSLVLSFLQTADAADCVRKLEALYKRKFAGDPCLPRRSGDAAGAPRASVTDVELILGYFEDVGTAYNRRELSRGVVHAMFGEPPVQVLTEGWWYVCFSREGRLLGEEGERAYEQWQRMAGALRRYVQQPEDPAGFILCLPPAVERRSVNARWHRARRLSLLLSANDTSLRDALTHLRTSHPELATGEGIAPDGWQVLLVPSALDAKPDPAWHARRLEASRFAWWVTSADSTRAVDETLDGLERAQASP